MFSTLSLFSSVRCPDQTCSRSPCPLSHSATTSTASVDLANVLGLAPASSTTTTSRSTAAGPSSILKRPAPANSGVTAALAREVKIRKVAVVPSSSARPSTSTSSSSAPNKRPNLPPTLPSSSSTSSSDCPILNFLPSQTTVPLKDRQRALQLLFSAFTTLYSSLPNGGPPKGLVAQHAMEQEQEGYEKGGKFGYKNALSNILVSLRKRSPPTTLSHPSIGTQSTHLAALDRLAREQASKLTPQALASLLLKVGDFDTWGYLSEVPEGEGGREPHCEGEEKECGRCGLGFVVPRGGVEGLEEGEGGTTKKCSYHWGRKRWGKLHGVRTQLATCCLAPFNSPGCTSSLSHVFKETSPTDLHRRVGFKTTEEVREGLMRGEMGGIGMGGGLEVGAMDCEMFYSTCGMSVGRVTLLDEDGKVVLDEFVRPDPAAILDLNTRFSGLHLPEITSAIMDLASVREALCVWVSPETTLVGHGLENDLLALRLVHRKVVDTAVIFPHSMGPPFRPALKDLASTHLQTIIQNSGDDGHSPEVDARTCLELVKLKVREARESGR